MATLLSIGIFQVIRPIPQTTQASTPVHIVQNGDTLFSIAARYNTSVATLMRLNNISEPNLIAAGQAIRLPIASQVPQLPQTITSPSAWLIHDSNFVNGPTGSQFDVIDYIAGTNGYLKQHSGYIEGNLLTGAEIIDLLSDRFSIDPRLLLTFLEYRSQWVTGGSNTIYPLGYQVAGKEGLVAQMRHVANQLNDGFYDADNITSFQLPDGTKVVLDPRLNAGSLSVLTTLGTHTGNTQATWLHDSGEHGLMETYRQLFGDPFANYVEVLPSSVQQPDMALPWAEGETWHLTGGPHGAWYSESAWAAIDFAPPRDQFGCYVSEYLVTAVSSGIITRSDMGGVVLDLDGDGNAGTGWAVHYMHLDSLDRIPVGAWVALGDPIGRPSCEGGYSTGTHLHIARSYNGRWIAADGSLPFNLDGWISSGTNSEYQGYMSKDGVQIKATQGRNSNGLKR